MFTVELNPKDYFSEWLSKKFLLNVDGATKFMWTNLLYCYDIFAIKILLANNNLIKIVARIV